jgi:DNA polymerase/3'-5' exonuclease PolX
MTSTALARPRITNAESARVLRELGLFLEMDGVPFKPRGSLGLTSVEGVGPKSVRSLYDKLGVRDVEGLKAACRSGKIRTLAHFGERSEKKILAACATIDALQGQRPLAKVLELATRIEPRLRPDTRVRAVEIACSVRRRKETIGDIDVLVSTRKPKAVVETFVAMPEVIAVLAQVRRNRPCGSRPASTPICGSSRSRASALR